jgi:uncharacterized protein YdcH (DUF465 family)
VRCCGFSLEDGLDIVEKHLRNGRTDDAAAALSKMKKHKRALKDQAAKDIIASAYQRLENVRVAAQGR